jgi:plastocyanin
MLALLVVFSLGSAAPVSAARTVTIEIGDNFFRPANVTIAPGDTVTWVHVGQRPHNVTADGGAFASPQRMMNGQQFSWTATAAGTYNYICTIHPTMMQASIVVQAAGAAPGMPRTGEGGLAGATGVLPWLLAAVGLAGVILGATLLDRRRAPR